MRKSGHLIKYTCVYIVITRARTLVCETHTQRKSTHHILVQCCGGFADVSRVCDEGELLEGPTTQSVRLLRDPTPGGKGT